MSITNELPHPRLKSSVKFFPIEGQAFHVYDSETSRHFKMGQDEVSWLRQLDGKTPEEGLDGRIPQEFRTEFLTRIKAMHLLEGTTPRKRINPMNIKVMRVNPAPLLERVGFLATPYRTLLDWSVIPVLILNVLLGAAVWATGPTWQGFGLTTSSVLAYLLAIGITGLVHELSHALVARSYNVTVPVLGLMIMFLHPTFYADVSAINLLGSRAQRIAVLTAGVKSNNLMALAGFIGYLSMAGHPFAAWCLAFAAMNVFLMLINLIPFVEYDGYYIFQELLGERHFAVSATRNMLSRGQKRADYALYFAISQVSKFALVITALSALRLGIMRLWHGPYIDYAFIAAIVLAYPVISLRALNRAR